MASYREHADAGIEALQQWYEPMTGLWKSTGWWNAANVLWVLIDYITRTGNMRHQGVIATTFARNAGGKFLNHYYDDEGWWALTWIKAYDLLHDVHYLDMARVLFADMQGGWDDKCGGGVWWSRDRKYKNAIPNELFLTIAARLYQRAAHEREGRQYLDWAKRTWQWFEHSGMINAQNLVNDGLDQHCRNNGGTTWTYNQGVILGGLVDLYWITLDSSYLMQAEAIADAAISTLVDAHGILQEPCESGDCGADGPQFKGIFMRNLAYLHKASNNDRYRQFILANADSLVHNKTDTHHYGLRWAGPVDRHDAARQSSALDAIHAALPFDESQP